MQTIEIFLYLQVLDLLTTLIGFRLGASEVSPFIRLLIAFGPASGVVMAKFIAVGIGGICVATHRLHLITWINYWFAGLVLWNFVMIFRALNIGV